MASDGTAPHTAAATDPRRFRMHVRPHPRVLESLLPIGAYVVFNLVVSTQIAIAASFVTSVVVFVRNSGYGTIRFLGLLGFAVLTVSAVLGLVSHSGKIYVAQNLVSDFIFAGVFAGSVAARRPLIGAIAREVAPAIKPVMAIGHPLFVRLTFGSAAINLLEGIARIALLRALSDNAYVIVSRVLFLPLGIGFYVLCYALVNREAILIWPAELPPPNRDGTSGAAA